MLFYNLLKLDH